MGPSLGRAAARGVLWTGFGQVLRQVIQIVSSDCFGSAACFQRILVCSEWQFFRGFAQLFADFGIGSAIIHRQELSQRILSSSFWFGVLVSTGLAVLVALARSPSLHFIVSHLLSRLFSCCRSI